MGWFSHFHSSNEKKIPKLIQYNDFIFIFYFCCCSTCYTLTSNVKIKQLQILKLTLIFITIYFTISIFRIFIAQFNFIYRWENATYLCYRECYVVADVFRVCTLGYVVRCTHVREKKFLLRFVFIMDFWIFLDGLVMMDPLFVILVLVLVCRRCFDSAFVEAPNCNSGMT
jgi:hypothetical protein